MAYLFPSDEWINALLASAYDELGWSPATGMPTKETVDRLGLSEYT